MDYPLLLGIFPQVFLDGIILGFMYALIALGYTMVYGVLEFINFAHSEIFIAGAFVGVEILLGLKSAGLLDHLPWIVLLLLVLVAAMLVSGLLAVAIERVAYRPLRRRGPGDGESHGREREPHHLDDVPDRRRDGRRGGRALRGAVRADQPLHRLHSGPEGVHRGRPGRDRKHPGRHGRRARTGDP